MKIAVSGKGGVGKTLVAGTLACFFANHGLKTLAIDADPSPNLALTLGISPEDAREIVPVLENEKLLQSKTDTGVPGVFRLSFTVDDVVRDFSIKTPCHVNLIVMGTVRVMGAGCTCPANAMIKSLLRHVVVERDEVVLLDMEAGVEHIGRGTAKQVEVMLIVTDSSIKSLEIARHIHDLAQKAGIRELFIVGNKIANDGQKKAVEKYAEIHNLILLDEIPHDEVVTNAEMEGETPLKRKESTAIKSIERIGGKLLNHLQPS
ncbi:MAG: P-loop NTPase [Candidatus Bathyarchaeota archaeon]|nr:MAG: P-loop NTPase [Candidatus Bathyarchaeota archaeon]